MEEQVITVKELRSLKNKQDYEDMGRKVKFLGKYTRFNIFN